MKVFGWVLFLAGVLLIIVGLNMDTTVANDSGAALGAEFTRTHNLGLLQNRELITQIGLALLICGSIFATTPSSVFARSKMESVSQESPSRPEESLDEEDLTQPSDEELTRLGIGVEDGEYRFRQYRFPTAAEAITFARDNQWMRPR